jgi:uncharacterized protein YndB with AHSA1/START domain
MSNQTHLINSTVINASKAKIWQVLTEPNYTAQYMHGCDVKCDWQIGNEIKWFINTDGVEIVYVIGNILDIEHENFISYSVAEPEQYEKATNSSDLLAVKYSLFLEADGSILLTITQGDYSRVENGEERYKEALEAGGWQSIIEQIKTIAELD